MEENKPFYPQPDFLTSFVLNNTVVVKISSDYDRDAMIEVMDIDDDHKQKRLFFLEPDEIDLFIATLTMFKNRILNGRKPVRE
jgi:hypothetical protein